MIWVSILAALVLLFSFIGGIKEGAVKSFFPLLALIIAIPVAGSFYHLLASVLSFLPGENWENFVGFFITLALVSAALHFIFFLPKKLIQKVWKKGALFRIIGGTLSIFGAAVGMVVFTLLVQVYPIFGWLEQAVTGSGLITWLVVRLSFVQAMLPQILQAPGAAVQAGPVLSLVSWA